MRLTPITLSLCILGQTAFADVCSPGGTLDYPLSETVDFASVELASQRYAAEDAYTNVDDLINPSTQTQRARTAKFLQITRAELAKRPQTEQDVLVLMMLARDTNSAEPLLILLAFDNAYALPIYLETLDRLNLNAHAALIRRGMGVFGAPDTPYHNRYKLWLASHDGTGDPRIKARLTGLSQRFAALPSLRDTALALLLTDPALVTKYEGLRAATPETDRYAYLIEQIQSCVNMMSVYNGVYSSDVARLPQPQQDILNLSVIAWQAVDGGFIEYFASPVSNRADEAVTLLEKHGLTAHAAALETGMAQFPTPYPRDPFERETIIFDMTQAQADAFHQMGAVFGDDAIARTITKRAVEAGLWPE